MGKLTLYFSSLAVISWYLILAFQPEGVSGGCSCQTHSYCYGQGCSHHTLCHCDRRRRSVEPQSTVQAGVEHTRKIFDNLDQNNDGLISLAESFTAPLTAMTNESTAEEEYVEGFVQTHFREMDANGDGFIQPNEFSKDIE